MDRRESATTDATRQAGTRMHDDEDADLVFMDAATEQPQAPRDDPDTPDESEDGDGMDEGDNIPGQGGEEQETGPGSRRPEPRQAA